MTTVSTGPGPKPRKELARRVRVRRALALAGMLTTIGGMVGLRANFSPSPAPALNTSGLVGPVAGASKPSNGPSPSRAREVLVGSAYDVGYGIVQVKVTVSGTRITDVTAMSLPEGGRSGDISSFAAPQLRGEALKAQGAKIDTVSGASYTSAGYAESLQSALDRRG